MTTRRSARGILVLVPLTTSFLFAACGGEEEAPSNASRESAPAETVVEDTASGGVAAPGSGFGLGSSGGGDGGGSVGDTDGGFDDRRSARGETSSDSAQDGSPSSSTTTSSSAGRDADLPEPPATAIEVPTATESVESYFENAADLDRDASNPKYAEFRELCGRNTDLLVRLARARKAMRDGGVREEEAYLAIDGQYAEFTEQMGNYMAQRRWNDRDREVMGLLLTRSNEEALNRVRTGS